MKALVYCGNSREFSLSPLLSSEYSAEDRDTGYGRLHQSEERGLAANEETVLTAGTWENTLSCSSGHSQDR